MKIISIKMNRNNRSSSEEENWHPRSPPRLQTRLNFNEQTPRGRTMLTTAQRLRRTSLSPRVPSSVEGVESRSPSPKNLISYKRKNSRSPSSVPTTYMRTSLSPRASPRASLRASPRASLRASPRTSPSRSRSRSPSSSSSSEIIRPVPKGMLTKKQIQELKSRFISRKGSPMKRRPPGSASPSRSRSGSPPRGLHEVQTIRRRSVNAPFDE